jgi:hypothetical protein
LDTPQSSIYAKFVTERFKSFRGAQPPRKLRWTNAGVEWRSSTMEIST